MKAALSARLESIQKRTPATICGATGAVLAVAPSLSLAAVDTAAVVTEISGNATAIAAVGSAIIALAALALGYKWIKGMIFS